MHFTLGHSPDPDDAFMFYALAKNKIDAKGHTFEHILQDIEQLNHGPSGRSWTLPPSRSTPTPT